MLAATVVFVGATLCLACTPSDATPSPTATAPSARPSGSPSPTQTPVELLPDGTARDNLPFFTETVTAVWEGPDQVSGRAYIDALVAGGFDKSDMQVTADQTTIGNPADSIEFSVRWGEECLVGQVGPEIGGVVTAVMPGLGGGLCLVGATRPIDW